MSALRVLWLALAIIGALPALARLGVWLHGEAPAPLDTPGWAPALTALTLTFFALAETYVRRNWEALWAIPAAWLVGPSCGLPLYLFLRTRPIR